MRKIRAWFKPLKRMYIARELKFQRNGNITVITNRTGGTAPNSYELMQFTGLKDKNGKEIFEGDIIKHPLFKHKYKLFVIKEISAFGLIVESIPTKKPTPITEYNRLEVIGNVWENPELLNDANERKTETGVGNEI